MKTGMKFWSGVVIVGLISVLFGWPQPTLDWEGDIQPLAHEFMGLKTLSSTPLKGLVVVITGATSGIGLSLASSLSGMGATIVAIGRSQKKLAKLQDDLSEQEIVPVLADLGDLPSVARAADEIKERFDRIDVIINNAGTQTMGDCTTWWRDPVTEQNYDQVFGVNYLSHFLLTEKLLPSLGNSAIATIVQISSTFHWAVDGAELMATEDKPPVASLPGGSRSLFFRGVHSYANSKLAQLLHSRALARQGLANIRVVNVCPGWVATHIGRHRVSHMLLGALAFPADGWGLASSLYALLGKTDQDQDYYINSKVFKIPSIAKSDFMFQPWFAKTDLRACLVFSMAFYFSIFTQKFLPEASPVESSPESYNITLQDSLYQWSKEAVSEWL